MLPVQPSIRIASVIHPEPGRTFCRTYYSLFVLCQFAARARRRTRTGGRIRQRRKDLRIGSSSSPTSPLVPSIGADKGKRRLAFSSMQSLSLFFLFHSLFSLRPTSPWPRPFNCLRPTPHLLFLHPNYLHHQHRVSSHLRRPRGATFVFFYCFFFSFVFFFFFFSFTTMSPVSSSLLSPYPSRLCSLAACASECESYECVYTDPRPPAFSELFSQSSLPC